MKVFNPPRFSSLHLLTPDPRFKRTEYSVSVFASSPAEVIVNNQTEDPNNSDLLELQAKLNELKQAYDQEMAPTSQALQSNPVHQSKLKRDLRRVTLPELQPKHSQSHIQQYQQIIEARREIIKRYTQLALDLAKPALKKLLENLPQLNEREKFLETLETGNTFADPESPRVKFHS